MTNFSVLENKASAIKKYLKILEDYKKYSKNQIESDLQVRGALERYLYLAIQSAIDLAEAVIAFKGYRKPATLRESFQILSEQGVVSSELSKKLSAMVGFRNIVAHDYEDLNYDIVYDILQNRLKDIEKFSDAVSKIK